MKRSMSEALTSDDIESDYPQAWDFLLVSFVDQSVKVDSKVNPYAKEFARWFSNCEAVATRDACAHYIKLLANW